VPEKSPFLPVSAGFLGPTSDVVGFISQVEGDHQAIVPVEKSGKIMKNGKI
jgi:hypothetical protein